MRILATILLAACATSPTPLSPHAGGPRGLRGDEHLEAARSDDELARQNNSWPDAHAVGGPGSIDHSSSGVPWMRSWDTNVEYARMATIHRSEASAIEAEYQEACGDRSSVEASRSPLQTYGYAGWNTSTGVIVYLTPDAGPPERLLADMRCHRAWMMLAATGTNMDDCPLDLPGIKVDARGDAEGISISIVVESPKLVDELHRRAARELEAAASTKSRGR